VHALMSALNSAVRRRSSRPIRDARGLTVAALRMWRERQEAERTAWETAWRPTGLVFIREDGSHLHHVATDTFQRLS
jgi:hypothetical protein